MKFKASTKGSIIPTPAVEQSSLRGTAKHTAFL